MYSQIKKHTTNLGSRGFTMVEIMMGIAIIGVLAAIAIPLYKKQTIGANRTDVETQMVQIAQKLSAYQLANSNYNTTLANSSIYGSSATPAPYPKTGTALYNLTLTATANSWTLTADAVGKQLGNGSLILNDQGWKCWNNPNGTTANVCVSGVPTVNTTWEGK